jgi:hypothetical protein
LIFIIRFVVGPISWIAKPSPVVNSPDRTAPPARVGSSSYFIDLSIFGLRGAISRILEGFWRRLQGGLLPSPHLRALQAKIRPEFVRQARRTR